METIRIQPPISFSKQEGAGLLGNYYQEDSSVENALQKRRQKLAEHKIGLQPDAEDFEPQTSGKSSL